MSNTRRIEEGKRSTGKRDRKGVEIFEGDDVLTWNVGTRDTAPHKGVIAWSGSPHRGFWAVFEEDGFTGLGQNTDGKYGVEVIKPLLERNDV